jgi:hypothetical protein
MSNATAAPATYYEFSRYCGQRGIDAIDEVLYTKLIQSFPFSEVYSFTCELFYEEYFRAFNREEAIEIARQRYPKARIRR